MNIEQSFENLKGSYRKTVREFIIAKLDNARNKPVILSSCVKQVNEILFAYSAGIEIHKAISNEFQTLYNSGLGLEDILELINDKHPEGLKIAPAPGPRDEVEYIPFSNDDKAIVNAFPSAYSTLLSFFAVYFALTEMQPEIGSFLAESKPQSLGALELRWTGEKDNKNEFVQLVYGLHKAGLLNHGKGEITKIVESMAEAFGVELGNNWQSNHSASIHKSKNGYNPPVFGKIRAAYEQYATDLVENKRKNR